MQVLKLLCLGEVLVHWNVDAEAVSENLRCLIFDF
jgi:hypothetical protein